MTDPLTTEAPSLIGVGAETIVDRAKALGLTWTLRLATVTFAGGSTGTQILYDGDTENSTCISLITCRAGDRVCGMIVPPSGNFIIGMGNVDIWHPFVFVNGWHNSVATAVPCQYRLLPEGVQLVGEMGSGTTANDTTVTTLPVGYRPLHVVSYPVACNPSPAVGVVGPLMQLKPNGTLVVWGVTSGTTYFNTIVPLDA